MQRYISIAGLGYFYVSNMALSAIFGKDLSMFVLIQEREAQAVQMVLDYLRAGR